MKPYQHLLALMTIIILIVLFYKNGFGAIPFLLAAAYLVFIAYMELRNSKNIKSSKKLGD